MTTTGTRETGTRATGTLEPIRHYRCEHGHSVLTRTPYEASQGSRALCILCFDTRPQVISALTEIK